MQKIITQNYFVFFFQYNNVTNKERVKLKNLILNLEKTTILVCKNKLTQQVLKHKTNFIELNQFQTKKISSLFFNQGYTTIIGLNNIEECLKLCLRLKIFNLKTSSDIIGDKFQNEFLFNLKKTQCLNKNKLTFIFNLKKNSLNLTGANNVFCRRFLSKSNYHSFRFESFIKIKFLFVYKFNFNFDKTFKIFHFN